MMSRASATLADVVHALDNEERGFAFVGRDDARDMSFATLRERALTLAKGLRGVGMGKGDRAIVILPKEEEFIQVFLGAVCSGVLPVPLFAPFMLNQLDSYIKYLELVARVSEASVVIAPPELHQFLGNPDIGLRYLTFNEIEGSATEGALPRLAEDDIALLQFTSGSTASPKGVAVTHRSMLASAEAIIEHIHGDPEVDRAVSWLPMYHDMGLGLVILPLFKQASAWYISPLDFVRRPQIWCETIDAVRGTIGFAPNFAYALLARRVSGEEAASWDLSSWRIAGCGGEQVQADALRAFVERLAPAGFDPGAFFPNYGMAETTLAVACPPINRGLHTISISRAKLSEEGIAAPAVGDEPAHEIVGCGSALSGHEIAILDTEGHRRPDYHEGEIVVRGPSVTGGYYKDEASTAETFRDGWLHTQDLGFLAGGEVFITGRKKDLIILQGRNYYPQDIEWCVQDIIGVRRGNAVAFASPDGRGEEAVVVVVEAANPEKVEEIPGTVATRIRAHIGVVVAEVVVIEKNSLPKTSSGKLQRGETKARYLAGSLPVLASSSGSRSTTSVATTAR